MRVLITGATGQVGGHLMWALWQQGHEVWALVRPESACRWHDHLARIQQVFGGVPRTAPVPRAVTGDVWLPTAGVVSSWLAAHRGRVEALIHGAADTRFHPVRREDQERTNVTGTRHVLDLAEALRVPRVIHLSTAFVAGHGARPLGESDLEIGQTFRCPYEATKSRAELCVRRWAEQAASRVTVLRPGIVLGTSGTGASLTFPHFYGFLRALEAFLAARPAGESVAVALDPSVRLPLVCVDDIARAVLAVLASPELPACLHLFDGHGPSLGEICETLCGSLAAGAVQFAARAEAPPAARAFQAWLSHHAAFLADPPRLMNDFTCEWLAARRVGAPAVDLPVLHRLHDWWLAEIHAAEEVPA